MVWDTEQAPPWQERNQPLELSVLTLSGPRCDISPSSSALSGLKSSISARARRRSKSCWRCVAHASRCAFDVSTMQRENVDFFGTLTSNSLHESAIHVLTCLPIRRLADAMLSSLGFDRPANVRLGSSGPSRMTKVAHRQLIFERERASREVYGIMSTRPPAGSYWPRNAPWGQSLRSRWRFDRDGLQGTPLLSHPCIVGV